MKHRYHQPAPAPFREPEFYENGPIVTISTRDRSIVVFREGEACLVVGENIHRTPNEFRFAFSNGVLPEEGEDVAWRYNGWFDLYEDIDGEYVHMDRIQQYLSDAIEDATHVLEGAS